MTLQIVQSEDFLLDLESQFRWYIFESRLDLPEAIDLANAFKEAVLETLNFLAQNPGAGRKRFPHFTDLEGTRSWQVSRPFHRFLIYYHATNEQLRIDRLIEGHRGIATDRG